MSKRCQPHDLRFPVEIVEAVWPLSESLQSNSLGNECYFLTRTLRGGNVGLQSIGQRVNVWVWSTLAQPDRPFQRKLFRADIRPKNALATNENNQQNVTEVYTMS
jgi:hypothetical protein